MLNPNFHNRPTLTTFQNQIDERSPSLPAVPVYFIHTAKKPFCFNERCLCHQDQAQIAMLLEAVRAGEMTLREAADFADGKTF